MAERIEDLLHRRTDLSTFLVHLTRETADANGAIQHARDNLLSIIAGTTLEARTPMGAGGSYFQTDPNFADTQRTVCFTETPLEHVWMMCREIEFREVTFQPYGLAFTKTWARRQGVNPVMYTDITPTGRDWLINSINEMLDAARSGYAYRKFGPLWQQVSLADAPIARISPFIEPMGKPLATRREWWWEREWRRVGNLSFSWESIVAVLVPENEHAAFDRELAARLQQAGGQHEFLYLDPRWGLERMIAALAKLPASDIGPFPI
jgi:hypothetical protein